MLFKVIDIGAGNDIGNTVAVDISDCHEIDNSVELVEFFRLKFAVTVTEKDAQRVVIRIGDYDIGIAIPVEVCHIERPWRTRRGENLSGLESAIPVAE